MKVSDTIEIVSEAPGVYHIPGVHNTQQTICGYVDCAGVETHDATDHPCNCEPCIEAVEKIKSLRFKKGYFEQ